MEVHGRIATVLVLLDQQDGEDFYSALRDAFAYLGKDMQGLDRLLEELEERYDD